MQPDMTQLRLECGESRLGCLARLSLPIGPSALVSRLLQLRPRSRLRRWSFPPRRSRTRGKAPSDCGDAAGDSLRTEPEPGCPGTFPSRWYSALSRA